MLTCTHSLSYLTFFNDWTADSASQNPRLFFIPFFIFFSPIIGHLHLLSPIPHQCLHKLSTCYGPIIHLSLGSIPCVIASTPESAMSFLKTHEPSFSNRPQNSSVNFLTYGSQDFSFAPYGPYWKFIKKLCMSELLCGRTLDLLRPVRRQEMASFLRRVLNKAERGEAVDMEAELLTLSNNVVSRMVMGQTCCEDEDVVGKLVKDTAEVTGKFNVSDFIWFFKNWDLQGFKKRIKEIRDKFDEIMDRVITEHQEERKKMKELGECVQVKDLVHILLDIYEDESFEIKLTKTSVRFWVQVNSPLVKKCQAGERNSTYQHSMSAFNGLI